MTEWKEITHAGYRIRKTCQDGQAAWQPFKKRFATNEKTYKLTRKIKQLIQKVSYTQCDDVTIQIGDITLNNSDETSHFIIQHFRIPSLAGDTISHLKLMQIAYNAGQYAAETYDPKIVSKYTLWNLGDLATYIE